MYIIILYAYIKRYQYYFRNRFQHCKCWITYDYLWLQMVFTLFVNSFFIRTASANIKF